MNPWDNDPIVQAAAAPASVKGNPWDNDPIVKPTKNKLSKEDTPGVGETLMIGAGKTFDSILDGITQGWLALKGDDKAATGLKQNVNTKKELYKPLQEARPFATAIGETLPALAVPMAGSGATALGTTARLAASGAVVPALEYGSVGERAIAAGGGAVGSVVGGQVLPAIVKAIPGATRAIAQRMVGEVSPEKAALFAKAQAEGIPVNAAQLSDSKMLKTLASTVEHVPLSGAGKTKEIQQKAFNRAVSRTIGEDTDKITREVYDAARKRLGGEFDRLSGQNELKVTPAMMADVNDVLFRTQHYTSPDVEKAVLNLATDLRSRLDTNTMTIPGSAYSAIDQEMSKLMKAGGEKSIYIGELQEALRKAMDVSIKPEDAAKWIEIRGQYRNLKTIRDIVAKEGADGNISPTLLMGRINANNAGKESMARGTRGKLGEVAEIGKEFVRETIPNSGTVQRAMAIGILGGGGMMAGMSPQDAGWLMLSGATSGRLVNRLLNSSQSGARMMTPAGKSIAELMKEIPNRGAQVVGAGAGMTLAELANR